MELSMDKAMLLLKLVVALAAAFYFFRSSYDRVIDLFAFLVLWALFGILAELFVSLLLKPLGSKISIKMLWFYTVLLVLAVSGIFLYNLLKPVKVKFVVIPPPNGGVSFHLNGKEYRINSPTTLGLREELSLAWRGQKWELRKGVYLLNDFEPVKVSLLKVVSRRRVDKVRRHLEVERDYLGTFGKGIFRVFEDPSVEICVFREPSKERLEKLGEVLIVEHNPSANF